MKKIMMAFLILFSLNAMAQISPDKAISLATKDAFLKLQLHFSLNSPLDLKDQTTILEENADEFKNRELELLLQKYPLSKNFYIKIELNDCVYQSMIYIVNKQEGKINSLVYFGEEVSIE